MKQLKTAIFVSAALAGVNGVVFAADDPNIQSAEPPNVVKGPVAPSQNKLEKQDLSDKQMQASESGADTEIIRMGFKRLDANDDGAITSDEASLQPPLDTQFNTVDKNQDKKIDVGEFAQFTETHGEWLQTEQDQERAKSGAPKGDPSR